MNKSKILQIMPAPQNLYAVYSDLGGVGVFDGDDSPYIYDPVVALALIEDEDGHRTTEPLVCDLGTALFDVPSVSSNFAGLCYREVRPTSMVGSSLLQQEEK